MSRITCRIFCATIGARPMLGSSSASSFGRLIRARPMASICCSPPESVPAVWLRRSASLGKSSNTRARSDPTSAPARGDAGEVVAVEPYRPRRRRRKTRDRAQGRRLPGAVRADQADELAPGDFEIDPLHRANAAVTDFEPADFEQAHADCAATTTPRYASITLGSR